jgi:DNA repair photolyase
VSGPPPQTLIAGAGAIACVKVVEVPVGEALARSLLAGYDWALNPYRGCAFDCLYCYAPDVVRVERSAWATTIFVKRGLPTALARELKRKERGVIGMSTVTDPYQPVERKLEVTRRCLEAVARAKWPVSVLTKSPLVTRDLDLLAKIPGAEVGVSLVTGLDAERKRWEASCPPVAARLGALKEVVDAGVRGYIFAGPLLPEGSAEGLRALARGAADAGAFEVMADTMHARQGELAQIVRKVSGLEDGERERRSLAMLRRLEEECRQAGVPFAVAANWKPRASGGGRGGDHLVAARAAKQDAPVLEQPGKVARLRAPLADALAVDIRLEEFD